MSRPQAFPPLHPPDPVAPRAEDPAGERPLPGALERRSPALVVLCCFLLIAAVGFVDYTLGPQLSFAVFYLIPIGIGAWWGGFSFGILFALASTLVWHAIDLAEAPGTLLYVRLWNGVVRFCFFAVTTSLLSRLRVALRHEQLLARTDPLTGVANGRTFYEKALLELHRCGRTRRPFTLAYLDLDNFKEVNDRRGHLAGDELLREVAETLRGHTRLTDLVARLGGDEFALLLPETDPAGAVASLTKLREALLRQAARRGWPVTFSIGAATFFQAPADVDVMIRRVDALMYRVKRGGKNRVEHEVVHDAGRGLADEAPKRERRATVRILCNHVARVSFEDRFDVRDGFARIQNISPTGIGLRLDHQLPEDTLLTIEPLCTSRVKTLLARVVRLQAEDGGWYHGCELSARLGEEELQDWLTEATVVSSLAAQPCGCH